MAKQKKAAKPSVRMGAKVQLPRTMLERLVGLKGEGKLRGVSYDALTDSFTLDIESLDSANREFGIDKHRLLFFEADEQTQNWPGVELVDQ